MKRNVIAEVALKDCRVALPIPLKGEQWRHSRNKRTIVVIKTMVQVSPITHELTTYVVFKYVRGLGGNGVGWTRKEPAQEVPLAEWRGFFRERAT